MADITGPSPTRDVFAVTAPREKASGAVIPLRSEDTGCCRRLRRVAALVTDEPADRASLVERRVMAVTPAFAATTGLRATEIVGCRVGDVLVDGGNALVEPAPWS